jgi:hypothetical protein
MTVLSVIQQSATRIGIAVPSVVFTDPSRTAVELQEAINEAAQGVIDDYDWQGLKAIGTVTGDGSATDFALPSNYGRMLKKARLWPSEEPSTPLVYYTDADKWLEMDVGLVTEVTRRAIIFGNRLHIKPAMANLATTQFFYVKNTLVLAAGDTAPTKIDFTADDDSFYLDERILKLSFIWRWKAAKGRPYGEEKQAYLDVIDSKAGTDKGSRILHVGRRRTPADATIAYPWVLGNP